MKISKGPDKNVQQGIDLFTPLFTPLLTQSRCEHCSGKMDSCPYILGIILREFGCAYED